MSGISRRRFAQIAGASLTAGKLALAEHGKLTAGEVVDRIKKKLGIPWNNSTYRDTFKIGGPDSVVTGIATSFGGNLRVLQLAQKAGLNMLIPHEPTFYSDGEGVDLVKDDPLYKLKLDWANRNNMVVWRIHDHWHAMKPDGIRLGWNHGLNWFSSQKVACRDPEVLDRVSAPTLLRQHFIDFNRVLCSWLYQWLPAHVLNRQGDEKAIYFRDKNRCFRAVVRPDAHAPRTAHRVVGRMGLALMLRLSPFRSVPAIRLHSRAVIDRQACIIADFRPRSALRRVFVHLLAPFARQIHLR